MALNSTLEKNFSWIAFPGLIRAIVMLQCVVFALILMKPETASYFMMLPGAIENGEYWRLISWIFYPLVTPSEGVGGLLNVIFLLFLLKISFLFSDSLEHAWGETRTSFYIYGTILCQVGVLYFIPIPGLSSRMLYLSIFFAFATIFPNHEFLLGLVLPVKVWILALFAVAGLLYEAARFPVLFPIFMLFYGLSFLPYLVWALPRLRYWGKQRKQISNRRAKFKAHTKNSKANSVHRCTTCQRTEVSAPDLGFRVAADGEEYCLDHLDKDGNPITS